MRRKMDDFNVMAESMDLLYLCGLIKIKIFRHFIVFVFIFAQAVFISRYSWSRDYSDNQLISIDGNKIYVTNKSVKMQTILFDRDIQKKDIKFEDLMFIGRYDLKILRTRGASQEFYDIYLFYPDSGIYVFNRELSDIPCLKADAGRKELVGSCFHVSSCENWEERYKISQKGVPSLIERSGTYCDPAGMVYSYIDRFKNGRLVFSKVRPLSTHLH